MTARKLPDWMLGKAPASEQKPKFIFTGEIKYFHTSGDFAIACEEILEKFADLQEIVIGFDLEWPITAAGSGRTALIQICPDESICYLFHVSQVYNLPIAFINFLSDTRVKLTGINIYNDFWKLVRDFSLKIQFSVQTKLIELNHLTNKVLKCDQKWSLEKLVSYLFKQQIIKDDFLRKSNWAADYLTEQQLLYAATDAFASLAVYKEITNKVGVMSFQRAVKLQKNLANEIYLSKNISDDIAGTLVLLEHPPTYTTGIRNRNQYISDEMHLRKLGADFCLADRGGLVTFHGPGQLVAYPVIDLRKLGPGGLRLHVARLEATGIQLCQNSFNLSEACAEPHPATGVWIGENKICAIGVRGSRQITMHGISINCSTDLSWFSHIVPCGLENRGVTSLTHELGRHVSVEETIPHFLAAFCSVFQCILCEYPKQEVDKIYLEDNKGNSV